VPWIGRLDTVRRMVSVERKADKERSGTPRGKLSDAELLAAHVAGDRYAFEELFIRHRQQLHRLASVSCRTPEDAADVVQDAMLAAHRNAATFRHHAAVSSWLHRIVLNACIDRLRWHRNHVTVAVDADAHTISDRTAQVETAIVVHRALRRLTVEQRAAVIAVDMQGYSISDAARLLGVAEGTVKSRCARGRARLAVELRQLDDEPASA
jgi:RNA polymerase sigma-70 factor (ECF subfamily)